MLNLFQISDFNIPHLAKIRVILVVNTVDHVAVPDHFVNGFCKILFVVIFSSQDQLLNIPELSHIIAQVAPESVHRKFHGILSKLTKKV